MTVCGVVAEYNPFHAGHAHHLAETRRALGEDTAIVCAMSGNFVQRGDLAVMEKYRRAEAAVQCGADLVLETPLSACLWSASGFSFGAVALLDALGCVTHLSFGAERADLALLRRAGRPVPRGGCTCRRAAAGACSRPALCRRCTAGSRSGRPGSRCAAGKPEQHACGRISVRAGYTGQLHAAACHFARRQRA